MSPTPAPPDALRGPLLIGVWALPVFGALLTLSTLTHQPDFRTDFDDYAQYVTTPSFLLSHLGASIVGAAFGIVGMLSLAALLAVRHRRPGRVLAAGAVGVVAHALNTAVFGVAAFAQPAIGRAYTNGIDGAVAVNDDVYGTELISTVVVAFVLWTVSAVAIGRAVRAAGPGLRGAGAVYAVSLPLFYLAGPTVPVLQPVFGAVFTAGAVFLASRISRESELPASAARTT